MPHSGNQQSLLQTAVFGSQPDQRLRIERTLTAAAVYAFSLLVQWQAVWTGRSNPAAAGLLSLFIAIGVCCFYAAIRTGYSERTTDPALTMPQMVFAMVSLALAYRINPHMRGTLLMVVALVVVFGAFTLSPRLCRRLGWIAVGLLACAMASGAWQDSVQFEPPIELVNFLFALVVLPTIALLAGQLSKLRVDQHRQKRELQDAVQRLHELATHDELTGLVNRRHVQDWIAHEVARAERPGASLCLALIDLDHFKQVNDTLGHSRGDEVLRIFSREARATLRDTDILARWGGEEFLLVMPDATAGEALLSLQRLRARMAETLAWRDCPEGRVTFSAGVAMLVQGQTFEAALQQADSRLYRAKQLGRDRFAVE